MTPTNPGTIHVGQATTYQFNAQTPTLKDATIVITLTKDGGSALTRDVSDASIKLGNGEAVAISFATSGASLTDTLTVTGAGLSEATHAGVITLTYQTAGSYHLTVAMNELDRMVW